MVLLEEIPDEDDLVRDEGSGSDDTEDRQQRLPHDENDSDQVTNNHRSSPLRERAFEILKFAREKPAQRADALLQLLTDIIKPLFSTSQHPQLTSTGRKNLVPAPAIAGRFNYDSLFDDSRPWKNGWTADLLRTILLEYYEIDTDVERKSTVEAQFHLLVPPILHMIDDMETKYKVQGCRCLASLCELLVHTDSDMMKRTGLTEVFSDALKKTFTYLPTLTPEDESLAIMEAIYPAFFALVDARFVTLKDYVRLSASQHPAMPDENSQPRRGSLHKPTLGRDKKPRPAREMSIDERTAEISQREKMLTDLLRNSLFYSLAHLSTGPSTSTSASTPETNSTIATTNTTSIPLTTFFLSQISPLATRLTIWGITAHLQVLLPPLREFMTDPFVLYTYLSNSAKDVDVGTGRKPVEDASQPFSAMRDISKNSQGMLKNATHAMTTLVEICAPRIRERWYGEILAAIVGCWTNILDLDLEENETEFEPWSATLDPKKSSNTKPRYSSKEKEQRTRTTAVIDLQKDLKNLLRILEDIMTKTEIGRRDFLRAKEDLVREEDSLRDLFETLLVE